MMIIRSRILPLDILVFLVAVSLVASEKKSRHRERQYENSNPRHHPKFEDREPHDKGGSRYKRPPLRDSVYITRNQSTVTARVGHTAHLPCSIQHLGTKQVSWSRQYTEHILTIGDVTWVRNKDLMVRYADLEGDVTQWNLTIAKVRPADEGTYICEIIDKHKQVLFIRLRVLDPPDYKAEIHIHGKEYVDLGEEVRLVCNATGSDLIPEDIDWFKDGDIVDTIRFNNIVITKYRSLEDKALVSELIIDRSRGVDSGTYICRSSENQIDSMEVTVLVANSSNVKRGSGSASVRQHSGYEDPFNTAAQRITSSLNMATMIALATIAFVHLWNS